MELLLSKQDGMWVVHVGRHMEPPPSFPLVSASENLFRLVTAIHNIYPDSVVNIDSHVSPNPFLSRSLFNAKYFRLTPDYVRVQYSLDHPVVKRCGLCGSEAWYNCWRHFYPHVGWWECVLPRCQAREYNHGGWYKLSRFARR